MKNLWPWGMAVRAVWANFGLGMEPLNNCLLVTGANGQLGKRLVEEAHRRGLLVTGLDREGLDVTSEEAIAEGLDDLRPSVVINAAAYTAVDLAESEPQQAERLNAMAPALLAKHCAARQIRLIHVSTDYVFGDVPLRPLLPSDPPDPQGVYGMTKWKGEQAVLTSEVKGCVVRVSWLYDVQGTNFLNTMLRLAHERGQLNVVNDQHGIPTAAPALASALVDMAERGETMPLGLWHFAHQGATTWHGFAQEIMALAGLNVPVNPVPTSAFPTAAKRPSWSVLDGEPLREFMGWEELSWQEALRRCWSLKSDA